MITLLINANKARAPLSIYFPIPHSTKSSLREGFYLLCSLLLEPWIKTAAPEGIAHLSYSLFLCGLWRVGAWGVT